jgi:hypothetical protein
LENLDAEVENNSSLETIREDIKISAKDGLDDYVLKKQKPRIQEGSRH